MTQKQTIHQLILEAADELGRPARSVRACETREAWEFTIAPGIILDIEIDRTEDRLIFTGDVCEVPEASRSIMYEVLLQYNYLWTETGGVRMALGDTAGQVVMMFELPLAGLQTPRLMHALANMGHSQRAWRQILTLITLGDEEPNDDDDDETAANELLFRP